MTTARSESSGSTLSAALQKYDKSVGLAYSSLPPELCDGTRLRLSRWSLVVTDACLSAVARMTEERVKAELEKTGGRKKYKKKLTEEEEDDYSQLTEDVQVTQVVSKKKSRLERSMSTLLGSDTGPTADEQNLEEENFAAQTALAEKVKRENCMKRHGLLELEVGGAEQVTDLGVKHIADFCTSLRVLDISGTLRVTDVGLRSLALSCPDLRSLNLSGCQGIAGPGFAVLGQCCRSLTTLKLAGCRQIPAWVMLSVFEGCRSLEDLDLSHCLKLSDQEVKAMAEKCTVLKVLNLKECKQVSDVGVLAVSQGCGALEELDLSRSELQVRPFFCGRGWFLFFS